MQVWHSPNECAFDKQNPVCSPKEVIDSIKVFLEKNGVKAPAEAAKIVDVAKKTTDCKSESCVLQKKEVKSIIGETKAQQVLAKNFKPSGPAFSFDWLSNKHIDDVLNQVEVKYKDRGFLHIPYQMRDFADNPGPNSLANINLVEKYKQGMRTFGVVINTDYSTGKGEHWFALYGDLSTSPMTLEYFNSSGDDPLNEINTWLYNTKNKLEKELDTIVKIIVCRTRHQRDSHSCGPYSLYYIISRLSGVRYETFHNTVIPDKNMHEFRKHLFRHDK